MKNILLVEDEMILAMSEKMQLEKHGYSIDIANSGEKAIEKVESSNNIDLILMDINLDGGMDGTEAAEAILNNHEIPIVFLSSHVEPSIVEKTEKISSYGYVVKSSSITVLDASIKMAFRLFDTKKQIEEVFEGSINGICIHKMLYDGDGNPYDCEYLRVNEAFHRHTGIDKNLEGLTIRDLYSSDEINDVIVMYANMLEAKEPLRKEFYFEPTRKWFELSGFLNRNSLDEFTVMIQDITERKRLEESLRKNEQKFEELFEHAPFGYQSLDEEGGFLEVNQVWTETLGYTKEEVLDKWFGDFLDPKHVSLFEENFRKFKESGETHTEFYMIHKNGEKILVRFDGRVGYNQDGSFKQTHCVLRGENYE